MSRSILWLIPLCILGYGPHAGAGDWPMWRYDAGRTAASPEQLPEQLSLLWQRPFSPRQQAWDDPLNLDLMTYDRVFEPIVVSGRLIVGFNDRNKVVAFDVRTGQELWTCYTEAPVRLPPAAAEGRVFFTADDGHLYCVRASDGEIQWRFRGGPSSQLAIGNRRLVSAWPARGGAVVRDGTVYFAASIWPFMGTFLYALDVETGEIQWVNDSSGSQYIRQPHSAPSFAGVAPQGAIVATRDLLIVPGGRSVPAAFDRRTGNLRYFELNAGGKGTGGSFVAADERHFYVHTRLKGTRAFRLGDAAKTSFTPNEPVLSEGWVFSAEVVDGQPTIRAYDDDQKLVWSVAADGQGDLIRAGNCLYAAGADAISAVRLPHADQPARVLWTLPVQQPVERLLAADGQLFAVTSDGALLAFAAEPTAESQVQPESIGSLPDVSDAEVDSLLAGTDAQGYALWFGSSLDPRVLMLAQKSPFEQLAIVDADANRVAEARRLLDQVGLYGQVSVHHSTLLDFRPPRYASHVVLVATAPGNALTAEQLRHLYESVRPYGGVLRLLVGTAREQTFRLAQSLELEQVEVSADATGVVLRRAGALPGSADWTHQYGDVANTVKSDDQRVKLPLGILWFGGSTNMDVLPRHGHGPPEQVVGGRLFIQGMNSLSARDVYTGRVLWKRQFEDLGTYDVYFDDTYEDTPLDPKYNQVHIPGANGRGTNYVVTEERVYLVEHSRCHVLDPATGETLQTIELPPGESGERPEWGYIGVYENVLIAGYGFARYRERNQLTFADDEKLSRSRKGFGSKSLDRAASLSLIGFDRFSGQQLWQVAANHSFWHNGIVAGGGKIYCLDRTPALVEEALRRRGRSSTRGHRILALDFRTGEKRWEVSEGIFGTWLGYSKEEDLLLQAGASASDRLSAEVGQGMAVYKAASGEVHWRKDSLSYSGPCILHNGLIITNANSYAESAGAFLLSDGSQKMVENPLTGELQPWKITRAYGCNNIIASENLLTFRSGAAGFYDLLTESGTGNFGGFKSGCTSNLVVANGVLNAPDYTRTCSCAYQNQTSLALVHMPEIELWTVSHAASLESSSGVVRRVGINFGAPGDRRDTRGLMWLDHPAVGGSSPPLKITVNPEAVPFRQHSSVIGGSDLNWVFASGMERVTDVRVGLKLVQAGLAEGVPVQDADDDAEENEQGQVGLGSSDLELVEDSGTQLVGIRFRNLDLPRNAVIRRAYVQFTCDEPTDVPTNLLIVAEDAGNAREFRSEGHDLSARTRTRAEVSWQPPAWQKVDDAGEAQRTPDLSQLVTAVTSRPDWKPGNALAFLISGTGKRVAGASRGSGGGKSAARLIIEADEAATAEADSVPADLYRVRLYFAAPRGAERTIREFDVELQDEVVEQGLRLVPPNGGNVASDAASEGGGQATGNPTVVRSFENIPARSEIRIRLIPRTGDPVLSGVEVERMATGD